MYNQQLWFCCEWMIGFNNILHSAWLQTKDFSCKNQESCSMVGIVESGLWWPHHSMERRLCLVWPQWSVCWGPNRGTERRSVVVRAGPLPGLVLVDGSSIQGCVGWFMEVYGLWSFLCKFVGICNYCLTWFLCWLELWQEAQIAYVVFFTLALVQKLIRGL